VPFTAELGGRDHSSSLPTPTRSGGRKAALMYDDAGQICLAGTRLLVEARAATNFTQADGRNKPARIGRQPRPRNHRVADDSSRTPKACRGFVERSLASGDTLVYGGHTLKEDGLWYLPTLIEPKSNDAEIVQHEVFGPVLTLQTLTPKPRRLNWPTRRRTGSRPWSLPATKPRLTILVRACAPAPSGQLLPRPRPDRSFWRCRHQRHWPRGRRLRARFL